MGVVGCEVLSAFEADAAMRAVAEAEIIFAAPDGEVVLRGKSFAGVGGDFVAVEAKLVKEFGEDGDTVEGGVIIGGSWRFAAGDEVGED